jgi:curved DNA-binding protein CbpA
MPDALDPYAVLGVSSLATPAEVTHAYRQKLRAQHPDTRSTQTGAAPVADEQLQRLLAAYAILRDPGSRAAYDRTARTTTQPRAVITTPGGGEGVDIPVTRNAHPRTDSATTPPLWAGPVRRHR